MSNTNVVFLEDHIGIDPILRKGDVVRIKQFGVEGIVVGIKEVMGPDSDAPGQASIIDVAVPMEEEWQIFEGVELSEIIRLIDCQKGECIS